MIFHLSGPVVVQTPPAFAAPTSPASVEQGGEQNEKGLPGTLAAPPNDAHLMHSQAGENPQEPFFQVHPSGFEPETSGSVDRCSIQLS